MRVVRLRSEMKLQAGGCLWGELQRHGNIRHPGRSRLGARQHVNAMTPPGEGGAETLPETCSCVFTSRRTWLHGRPVSLAKSGSPVGARVSRLRRTAWKVEDLERKINLSFHGNWDGGTAKSQTFT